MYLDRHLYRYLGGYLGDGRTNFYFRKKGGGALKQQINSEGPYMMYLSRLVREVKNGEHGDYKRLEKKSKMISARDNVKLWLHDFFESICDVMTMCENNNGITQRHLRSWHIGHYSFRIYKRYGDVITM